MFRILSILVFLGCFSLSAQAASVTFSNFQHAGSDAIDYIVTVDDNTAGKLTFTYKVDMFSTFTVAKLTGFFFDAEDPSSATDGPYTAANLGFIDFQPGTSCAQGFNTNQIMGPGGCNTTLQLGAGAGSFESHMWDVGVAWKTNDLSLGQIGTFEVSNLGGLIGIGDIGSIGLRGQETTGSGGSAKEFELASMNPVPVPAAIWLFGSALIGFVGMSRKTKV